MVDAFDVRAELAEADDRVSAWRFIQGFLAAWATPLSEADGCDEAELAAAEDRTGMMLPAAVREAYGLFGRRADVTSDGQDEFLAPKKLYTHDGLLKPGQAEQLRDAGALAYNHNLNTSAERYADICTTHGYEQRVETVREAADAGLSPCSGAIFGMGESDDDVIDVAFALRDLSPDSVPVNFLMPFEGTPLARTWQLTPLRCLRILALFRLVFPDVEVRLAGGREIHLRGLQPLALHLVNSIFLGDYLTSEGQTGDDDLQMIADGGFVVDGAQERAEPDAHPDLVVIRDRGLGTDREGNV